MKQSLNYDTLAYQIGMRPGVRQRNMGDTQVSTVVKQGLLPFENAPNIYSRIGMDEGVGGIKETPMGNAMRDGLIFYMLNHAVSLIRQKYHFYQPLGDKLPVLECYHQELAVRASRMFYYMLLICTRESRHDKTRNNNASTYASILAPYGPQVKAFHYKLYGLTPTTAAQKLRDEPPEVDMGRYTRFLSDIFHKGTYSSGYGGPAWGAVADVLRDFVIGKLSAEMMLDTSFTLCHNNGPIFNKGMLFDSSFSDIKKMLDVQRSGQIPQLIQSESISYADDPQVQRVFKLCKQALGNEFTAPGYVDWYKVEELGALGTYTVQKAAQVKMYGYPSNYKAKMEAEAAKAEVEAKAAAEKAASQIEVFPGQYITKKKERV